MAIEETFSSLEEIIAILENKETTLEDAFAQYEKGIKLVKDANDALDALEKKKLVLQGNGEVESVDEDEFK